MPPIDRYTCEETFRRLDDYLDRRLTPHGMQLVREHLDVCAICASEYKFEADMLTQVREKLQRIAAPANLLAKISRALAEAEASDDRSTG
jgi:anti-sigma factor (TIGR02949 family)